MAHDIRLMWPSTYDPITDTHVLRVGSGINRKMYAFTSEEWDNYAYVNGYFKEKEVARHPKYTAEAARLAAKTKAKSGYDLGWVDPRGLSYLSSEADRKAADAKIQKEYDDLFSYSAELAKSMRDAKDKAVAAVWTTHSDPTTWSVYAATRGELPMNPFLDKVMKMEYVGSRVTCSPPPTDTDEDVLVLTDDIESLIGDCLEAGFNRDGSIVSTYPPGFVSLRHGKINLIVTDEEEFFKKFMLATHVCKFLNLQGKVDRICVFQAILYGNEYGGVLTAPEEETPF